MNGVSVSAEDLIAALAGGGSKRSGGGVTDMAMPDELRQRLRLWRENEAREPFKVGDLVDQVEGLAMNREGISIVMEVRETAPHIERGQPIIEPDLIVGKIAEDGTLLRYAVESRRFKLYEEPKHGDVAGEL